MDNLIDLMFGNIWSAIIFICVMIIIIYVVVRFNRFYVLLEILILILIYSLYISFIIPAIIETVSGDSDTIFLYQLAALSSFSSEPSLSLYLYMQTLKPLAGFDGLFDVLLNLIGSIVLGMLLWRAIKKMRGSSSKQQKSKKERD